MSLRVKAAIVIILIFLTVTAANYFSSLAFTTKSLSDTMQQELSLALDIADTVVAAKIGLLKSNAETVAERLYWCETIEEMEDVMALQMVEFTDFISLTVYSRSGLVVNFGHPMKHDVFNDGREFILMAFDGVKVLSSPHYNDGDCDLVMHVFVPMGPDLVLSATIPGMLFSDLLSHYRLWQTGSIFLVDSEGTFIANYRSELVEQQRNFITEADTSPDMKATAEFYRNMISSKAPGSGRYIYEGQERFCVYKYVSDSIVGWRIGVVAPLAESPQKSIRNSLLFASMAFLATGVVLSVFISAIAVKPFIRMEKLVQDVERRDDLLNTGNSTAKILLSREEDKSIESSLMESMALVGRSADADRVQIWRNETIDGSLHFVHTYEWTSDVGRECTPVPIGLKFPYSEKPEWEKIFMSGECINGPISALMPEDREFLETYDMKTIVIIPLFLRDVFWGFFSIDDCRVERTFTEDEIRILRSVSLLMINAIDREAQAAQIREANEYTELLIEALPLSCNMWDREYNLFKCNEGSVRIFEVSDKEDFLEHFGDFSPEYQPDGRLSSEKSRYVIKKAFDEGIYVTEWMHQKRDGTPIPTEVTLVRVAHSLDYVVAAYVRDLREQKRMMAEIDEIMLNLQSANSAKSDFLAKMSHEMRTPLNAIIGLSELALEDETVREDARYNIEKVSDAGTTLLSTVNDILDFSKIEAGKLELVPTKYALPSLINDTVTQSIMHIEDKQIEFVLDIDESLPTQLCGDDLRIRQIINNLLSNAFKYTRKGTVELGVRCEPCLYGGKDGEESVWMIIWVRDTGAGIKPEDIDSLFSEFVKLDTQVNRNIMGTGLGLPITKKMTELMNGTITVDSVYGKGSVFTVRLMQKFVTDEKIGPEVVEKLKNFRYSDHKRRSNSKMTRIKLPYAKVLIVDDTVTNLDVAKGLLKPYSMQVDCVTSGQQAIEVIREEKVKYNAIFMDHMMPGMDGIEATRRIRELGTEYAENVPIIACTANAIIGNDEMFLSKGFQAFLSKPIEIASLDEIVRKWVRDKTQEPDSDGGENGNGETGADAGPRPRAEREEPAADAGQIAADHRRFGDLHDEIDVEKGIGRFRGDMDVYLGVLRSYAFNTSSLLGKVRGVNSDNLADYAIIVHGIKGSSRDIQAAAAGDMAEALEMAAKRGDIDFIYDNNQAFVEKVERLIKSILKQLARIESENARPTKDKPDRELLKKLMEASENFELDAVDKAMKEIDAYEYSEEGDLVEWLKTSVAGLDFVDIVRKLSGLVGE